MKISNAIIYNAMKPLEALLKVKMPVQASYALIKLASEIQPQMEVINRVRQKLIVEHGEPDEKRGGQSRIAPEMDGFPKFAEEMGILLEQDFELEDFKKIRLPDNIEIEPVVLMALENFIMLEVEVKTK